MHRAWHALAAYTIITVAGTWPLARGLGRDVPWDLGDSLLVMWAIAWDAEQLLAILQGDVSRLLTFFDANIFYPSRLTLAYSEHLVPQALQVLPIYALTGNPILCYNLLFLSTFVLSGFGTYLFVRELTGRPIAAFVAGLLFAFAPYRLPQSSHLQVLSAQWMPFALYGFRRYFAAVAEGRGGLRPLSGAALALIAQNLSCGYYLLYFSPFAGAYAVWEIARGGLWGHRAMWARLAGAAAVVLAVTLPFLLPYAAVNELFRFERSRSEVVRFSADVYSYATASAAQPIGRVVRAFPKPEGDLFPGIVPLILAGIGVLAWRQAPVTSGIPSPRRRALVQVFAALAIVHVLAALVGIIFRRLVLDLWLFELRITDITQLLLRAAVSAAIVLALSRDARAVARAFFSERGFFAAALIAAVWLSLGPVPQVLGRPVELASPYAVLYDYVPGFDGVRVPARFAMIAALMLAMLGGYGAAAVARLRLGRGVLAILGALFMAETLVLPFTVNGVTPPPGYNTPEARVYRPARAPAVYHAFARVSDGAVLAELPLGEPDFDLRAIFYSIVHWRPLVNGYSGFFPPYYGRLALAVNDAARFPEVALDALRRQGATHVIVHEGAFLDGRGASASAALVQHGATELFRDGADVLLRLP